MITPEFCKELQYFVNKVCTIITPPMALPLSNQNFPEWFSIKIEAITPEAIVGSDLSRNTKSVFFFPIIGIAEEQLIEENHPDYEKVKDYMEEKKKDVPLSVAELSQQASLIKNKFAGNFNA